MMDLKEGLTRIARALNITFSLKGRPIDYTEVFSDVGVLPAIAKRADQLSTLCFGYGIGVTFTEVQESRLGVKSTFDDETPEVLRYACMTDILYELMNTANTVEGQVALDELLHD